jgi:hypothetical protein
MLKAENPYLLWFALFQHRKVVRFKVGNWFVLVIERYYVHHYQPRRSTQHWYRI